MSNSVRGQAQGLYHEPTAVQVERLIAAAKGEEYKPPEKAPLYSKPTAAQIERLIAAVGAGSSGMADVLRLFAEHTMSPHPTQNEVAAVVKAIFSALGGTVAPEATPDGE